MSLSYIISNINTPFSSAPDNPNSSLQRKRTLSILTGEPGHPTNDGRQWWWWCDLVPLMLRTRQFVNNEMTMVSDCAKLWLFLYCAEDMWKFSNETLIGNYEDMITLLLCIIMKIFECSSKWKNGQKGVPAMCECKAGRRRKCSTNPRRRRTGEISYDLFNVMDWYCEN